MRQHTHHVPTFGTAFAAVLPVLLALLAVATPAAAQSPSQMARGAQLYSSTCGRCHDARSPAERTDRQWATIMAHMRARANLTEADAEAILAFMQATNIPEGSSASVGSAAGADSREGGSASDVARREILRFDALRKSDPKRAAADLGLHTSLLRYLARLAAKGAPVPSDPDGKR